MNYKPEDVLFAGDIFKEYNEHLIRKYLDLFTLDNLNIYFDSNSFATECELTEKWYGTKYHKEKIDITDEEINSYICERFLDYDQRINLFKKILKFFQLLKK